MNIKKLLFILTLILSLSFASNVITFQGRLIDSTGAAVNGYRKMGFRIYNTTTEGTVLMKIPQQEVLCNDGNYAVLIDLDTATYDNGTSLATPVAETAMQIINNNNVWIEVYVGARSITEVYTDTCRMSPRISLTATPYAVSTKQIQGLNIKRFKTGVTDNMEFYY